MQITTILLVALSAFVSAAPFQKRDVTTVLSDISAITRSVSTLTSYVNSYTGFANQNHAIVSTVKSLKDSSKTATADADSSYDFSEADSESIANAITALTPNVITLLIDLMNKSSTVAAANYTTVVESSLTTLMIDTDNLLTALTDKVTEEQTGPLGTSADQINYAFNMAITTY